LTYSVRTVSRAKDAPQALWDAGFAPPIEGKWWYEVFEQSGLEGQFAFLYAVVEREGRAVGLAPMFVADVPIELVVPDELFPVFKGIGRMFPGVMAQRTLFVGSPCADEGAVAILEGEDRVAVLAAIASEMPRIARRHKAFMLVWKDAPEALCADMAKAARRTGFFSTPSYPGAEARFPTGRKADFLAAMKASHRQQLKRKLRRSVEAADLSVEVVQAPGQGVLEEIFALFLQTYEKAVTRFERLDLRFFERVAIEPRAHFLLLRDRGSGRLAAFMLLFDLGDTVINKFIGIDYARPKDEMLYFRLTDAAIDWAIAKGATRLQSGQTGYRVKIELGHALTPLNNFGRHRIWPIHVIYALVARTISWKTLDADLAHHLQSHPENPLAEAGKWR
jgi:hypothetical protein